MVFTCIVTFFNWCLESLNCKKCQKATKRIFCDFQVFPCNFSEHYLNSLIVYQINFSSAWRIFKDKQSMGKLAMFSKQKKTKNPTPRRKQFAMAWTLGDRTLVYERRIILLRVHPPVRHHACSSQPKIHSITCKFITRFDLDAQVSLKSASACLPGNFFMAQIIFIYFLQVVVGGRRSLVKTPQMKWKSSFSVKFLFLFFVKFWRHKRLANGQN